MSNWSLVELGEVAQVKGGKRLPKGMSLQEKNNGSPYLRIVDWLDGYFDTSKLMYVPDAARAQISRYTVSTGDVFISIAGTVGRISLIPAELDGAFLTENAAKISVDSDLVLPQFLKFALSSPQGQEEISSLTVGSTQPKLALQSIKSIRIPLPPLVEQRAIAEVLGALDDKIAANSKLVETLTSTFSAHWKTLGSSPTAKNVTVESLLGEMIGGDWGTAEATESSPNEVYCIRGADIADLQQAGLGKMPRRFLKTKSLERRQLEDGDLVVEMSGGSPTQSTGRTVLVTDELLNRLDIPLTSSNFCRIVRPKDPMTSFYLYGLLQASWDRGEFFSFENGSTGIKNLAFADYSSNKAVALPSLEALKQFNQLARSLFKTMHSLGAESSFLAETRDALLPQLISGKMRVRDAEAVVEDVL